MCRLAAGKRAAAGRGCCELTSKRCEGKENEASCREGDCAKGFGLPWIAKRKAWLHREAPSL
jgi:hypothetical protein